ncbi:MAG: hypothetical protein ABMB14_17740 [Myxococcota bacterium]
MMLVVAGMVGCWDPGEQAHLRRVWEMEDHVKATTAAREALGRGDLAGVHQAGEDLAAPDPLPGLPEAALPPLEAVRAGGRTLAAAPTLPDAAAQLVAITRDCAACHRALAIQPPVKTRQSVDPLWVALAFESDERWTRELTALGPAGAPLAAAAPTWDARRAAVVATLVSPPGSP